jgi:RNA polymerase sigma-70 factor (ECF subfamily)
MVSDPTKTAAVEALWREFSQPLRAFLRKRARSAADADDLLQEVFLRVHRQLPTLRDPSKLQGWVYRIARNAVIDHYRTRRSPLEWDADSEAADPEGRDEVDLAPSLRKFVSALPPIYRDALIRHEFQGQPLQEIAQAKRITLTAAKSRVRRARLLLRQELDACCRFELDRRGHVIDMIPRRPAKPACNKRCRC